MKKGKLLRLLWQNRNNLNYKNLASYFEAFLRMLPLLLNQKYKARLLYLFLGLLAVAYAISPLDFIPEIALGPFGLIDDLMILSLGLNLWQKEIHRFLRWEAKQKTTLLVP